MRNAAARLEPNDRIVEHGDGCPNDHAASDSIGKADHTAFERHGVADERLAEQAQMWADNGTSLEREPHRGQEEAGATYDSKDERERRHVETQHSVFEWLIVPVFPHVDRASSPVSPSIYAHNTSVGTCSVLFT